MNTTSPPSETRLAKDTTPGIIFAGGGTGGHIFPAIAILQQIEKLSAAHNTPFDRTQQCVFLCSTRSIDERILTAQGVPFQAISAAPLGSSPAKLIRFVRSWGGAVRQSRSHIRELARTCNPLTVLATGGFVAAPVVQAARAEGVPIIMLNQDTPPGKANRWIARHAQHVFTTAPTNPTNPTIPADPREASWEHITPVIRQEALAPADQKTCKEQLGLAGDRPVLFITGASQGAQSINEFVKLFVQQHAQELAQTGWQIVHQTGQTNNDELRKAYANIGITARVEGFFDAMGLAWGSADVALSRAGASSVAEAWANCVPTLFLPYPYHRDEHQRFNAGRLEEVGGAIIKTDHIHPETNILRVGGRLRELMQDPNHRTSLRHALKTLGPVDGACHIAQEIITHTSSM